MMAPAVAGWVVNIDTPRSVSVRVWGLPSGVTVRPTARGARSVACGPERFCILRSLKNA